MTAAPSCTTAPSPSCWTTTARSSDPSRASPGTGGWSSRRSPEAADAAARDHQGIDVEVLLAHPTGFVEIYTGRATGARVDLTTDVVARTTTAKEYTAAQRMYGMVEGDLLWVMDMAAVGDAHVVARLRPAEARGAARATP